MSNNDDSYYSVDSGLHECKSDFLKHNNLEERFLLLKDNDIFVIGETCFGSSLNFLIVLQLWQKLVKVKAKLFFISFEKHPIHPSDLKKIVSNFSDLEPQALELLAQYYLPLPATHRYAFNNQVYLNLAIGDIHEILPTQNFRADAWFFDGPTSKHNPKMWNESIFRSLARLSKTGTTFATYTATPSVRKHLITAGFEVSEDNSYNEREMLFGHYCNEPKIQIQKTRKGKNKPTPWFDKYTNQNPDKHIIVIGGGISGASTAHSLAKRGYFVTLYEQNSEVATAASGNDQAMLYGNFSPYMSPIQELSFSGYRYTHNLITKLLKEPDYSQCGLIQLALENEDIETQDKLIKSQLIPTDFCHIINQEQIKQIAGIEINCSSGIHFPYGIWLNPPILIKELLNLPNIKVITNTKITDIKKDTKWSIFQNNDLINQADNIVLCNADSINQFTITQNLNIRKIRGQISIINQNLPLNTIICGNGYITPNRANSYTIGATFDFKNIHNNVTREDHIQNLTNAQNLTDLLSDIEVDNLNGQAAIRASTYDYMPLVGPIADFEKFTNTYQKLSQDANFWLEDLCPHHEGLFINAAHGAKGMLSAPICGEIIADYIDNTPLPCSENLRLALHPNRIYTRHLIKGKS